MREIPIRSHYSPYRLPTSDKKRICLKCNKLFNSNGPHNRICGKCRIAISQMYVPEQECKLRSTGVRVVRTEIGHI